MPDGFIIIDTPDGIAFARAAARLGALKTKQRGVFTTVKDVYGFTGGVKQVTQMLQDYIDETLRIRHWEPAYAERIQGIAQEAIRRVEEEQGPTPRLQQYADGNVQAAFDAGDITEQQGNDACALIFTEVVRQHAGRR